MKKAVLSLFTFVLITGMASLGHAYSYSFDFLSGGVNISVADAYESVSITTTSDLVVQTDFDLPPEDALVEYTGTMDVTLKLWSFISMDFAMADLALGDFVGIDPYRLLGDGDTDIFLRGSELMEGEFGGYTLTGATLDYDVSIFPDASTEGLFAIRIDTLTLSGGNTDDLLTGLINELNQSGAISMTLDAPFSIPVDITGDLTLDAQTKQADAVPVPSAAWLLGTGLIGFMGLARRRDPA